MLKCAAMAKCHAFEVAFVMAGSMVNQDHPLGFAFTTAGAEDVHYPLSYNLTDLF